MGFDADHDAVLREAELGVVGVDGTGGFGSPFEEVAAVGTAEELLLQGALEGVAADLQFHGAGMECREGQEQKATCQERAGLLS